jgi:hypothetical protein
MLEAVGLALHDGVFAPLPALLTFLGNWLIHVAGMFMDSREFLLRRFRSSSPWQVRPRRCKVRRVRNADHSRIWDTVRTRRPQNKMG